MTDCTKWLTFSAEVSDPLPSISWSPLHACRRGSCSPTAESARLPMIRHQAFPTTQCKAYISTREGREGEGVKRLCFVLLAVPLWSVITVECIRRFQSERFSRQLKRYLRRFKTSRATTSYHSSCFESRLDQIYTHIHEVKFYPVELLVYTHGTKLDPYLYPYG